MAITYNWTLTNVDIRYLPETSEAQIMEIHWHCLATDSDSGESVTAYGSLGVEDENYIFPAATIKNTTKSQVFQWLNNKFGDEKAEIETGLADNIAEKNLKDNFMPV